MADVHSTVLPFHVHHLVIVLPTGAYRFEYAAIGPRCWYAHCETTGERTTCYNEQFCRNWCYDRAQALDAEARKPEPPSPAKAAPVPFLLPSATESGALERFIRWMKACMPQQIDSLLLDEREAAGEFEHDGDARIETMRHRLWATDARLNARREAVRYLQAFGWSMDVNDRMFNVTAERLERERNLQRVRSLAESARTEIAIAA